MRSSFGTGSLCAIVITLSGCAARAHPESVGASPLIDSGVASSGQTAAELAVREVLDRPGIVGREVVVRGRCLRTDSKSATGGPPRTRSDWPMADVGDSTIAVWVSGPRPDDCGYETSSRAAMRIRGIVTADSLAQLGGSRRERRYLVRSR